jgi:hypothetical protein
MNTQQQTQQQKPIFIYRFYIGSNNKTHLREKQKAINLLNKNGIKGYSVFNAVGLWESIKENSFIIEIINTPELSLTENKIYSLKGLLEKDLKQFLVLLVKQEIKVLN